MNQISGNFTTINGINFFDVQIPSRLTIATINNCESTKTAAIDISIAGDLNVSMATETKPSFYFFTLPLAESDKIASILNTLCCEYSL